MSKPKVFILRQIPNQGLDLIQEFCEADIWQAELPPSRAEILERAAGVEGLVSLLTDAIDGEIMDAAGPQLKVISNHAVGFDNIAVAEATARRIPVGNTPGILTDATADLAFALLLAAGRRITEAERFVHAGRWKTWGPSLLLGADLAGATLGLIGFGRIGKAVAKRAAGFDLRVIYYDPYEKPDPGLAATPVDSLDILLQTSDFVSLHTPLNDNTYHLMNAATLRKMKPSAILINTARGGIVDPQALYTALKEGHIAAAALDVTEPEPILMDSPLLTLENLLIVPHIASASQHTRQQMSYLAAINLIAGLKGERLPYCVNPQVYEEV